MEAVGIALAVAVIAMVGFVAGGVVLIRWIGGGR